MSEAKRTIIVHAYDDSSQKNGIGYGMSGLGVKNEEIACSKERPKQKMKKKDAHVVVFELANRSRRDLRFPEDKKLAIWVCKDDQTCPTKPEHHSDDVVQAIKVSDDGEQLTVRNLNPSKGRYKFSLNFIDLDEPEPRKLHPYDPVWDNHNGGFD